MKDYEKIGEIKNIDDLIKVFENMYKNNNDRAMQLGIKGTYGDIAIKIFYTKIYKKSD